MMKINQKNKFAVLATDVIIFTVDKGQLKVLLIDMKKAPHLGDWAAPGGLVKPDESIDAAVKRILKKETSLSDIHLEQLYTFGKVDRDPIGRVVSVAYLGLISINELQSSQALKKNGSARLFSVSKMPSLAYDHKDMVRIAKERIQAKLEYTNIVYSLLSKEFTFTDLQDTYEAILERAIDKRNFRKKILATKILKNLKIKRGGDAHRPAELYSFINRTPQVIKMI